mmetsp:Transcript_60143/g.143346  ORF Transcript_60143/g.143346 Transcript_60143/m.143346 type:complete len:335 (-) Transcript_60143:167-1171(-)
MADWLVPQGRPITTYAPPGLSPPFPRSMPSTSHPPLPLRLLSEASGEERGSATTEGNGDFPTAARHLIWCYEYCHHHDNAGRRELIERCFPLLGYGVKLMRKSEHLAAWLQSVEGAEMEEYLLVMGWREAQPCLRHIAAVGIQVPTMSIILCNGPKQYKRASNYVVTLSGSIGPVVVCTQDGIPADLFSGVLRACFGSTDKDESFTAAPATASLTAPLALCQHPSRLTLQEKFSRLTDSSSLDSFTMSKRPSAESDTMMPEDSTSCSSSRIFERLSSPGSSSSTPSDMTLSPPTPPAVTSPVQHHIGKGKGNGLPVPRKSGLVLRARTATHSSF